MPTLSEIEQKEFMPKSIDELSKTPRFISIEDQIKEGNKKLIMNGLPPDDPKDPAVLAKFVNTPEYQFTRRDLTNLFHRNFIRKLLEGKKVPGTWVFESTREKYGDPVPSGLNSLASYGIKTAKDLVKAKDILDKTAEVDRLALDDFTKNSVVSPSVAIPYGDEAVRFALGTSGFTNRMSYPRSVIGARQPETGTRIASSRNNFPASQEEFRQRTRAGLGRAASLGGITPAVGEFAAAPLERTVVPQIASAGRQLGNIAQQAPRALQAGVKSIRRGLFNPFGDLRR